MRLGKTLIIAALPLALAVGCETSNEGKAGMNDKAAMQAQSDAKRAVAAVVCLLGEFPGSGTAPEHSRDPGR